MHALKFDIF